MNRMNVSALLNVYEAAHFTVIAFIIVILQHEIVFIVFPVAMCVSCESVSVCARLCECRHTLTCDVLAYRVCNKLRIEMEKEKKSAHRRTTY